ncbi:Sua5/YciO/YrdC/YwlC family protein [Sulfurimonas sp.]|uniref:Sua5/YciO/YrdC/YwlC family protein n=1 Tax=Sulfurimonas sp. TaxID=2022749 RepID=UPI002AB0EF11|nr:Sua5/YciO/YrdC/YwlC family protein [Sulfurimonas sp.]
MDKFNCTSRLSRISEKVVLCQSDTTVGFSSQNAKKLQEIKNRKPSKSFIKIFKDLKKLNKLGPRIPEKFKNSLRRANKSSFIVKNIAFRIANNSINSQIFRDISWHYSTSANETGKNFNREFCEEKADIIIENKDGLRELSSSSLFKINQIKRKK